MNRRFYFLSGLLIFLFFLTNTQSVFAQNTDSIRNAQKQRTDSLNAMRLVQRQRNDSIKAERERVADSIAAIRSYLRSKQYNDSLDLARQKRLDSIRLVQQKFNDSVKAERQRVADSLTAERQRYNDSLKTALAAQQAERQRILDSTKVVRQRITDSLAAIREYRQSDQYKDSVAAVRKRSLDSMKAVRMAFNDSVRSVRKQALDSMVAVRKAYNDSMKAVLDSTRTVRQAYLDSMKVVRLARADSMAKVKEIREAARKEKVKENEKKKGLALELKIKKKQQAYSNEKMRKKKWSIPRQVIQNTFTRYNYFFNANKKMEEAEDNMRRAAIDNYDSTIALFPFNPDRDSAKLKTDMDTIISKASVGIQIHDPRTKWADNLYLLAGQAFYYKGDYKNAAASFKYIVAQAELDRKEEAKKAKTKLTAAELSSLAEDDKDGLAGIIDHKTSKNEAMLWLSRTFTQDKQEGQAQALLDILANDPNFPERLKGQLALEQAYIDLNRNDYNKAISSLSIVAEDKNQPDWLRQRAAFLNGQLLQNNGSYEAAEKYFNIAIDLHPALDMDFYARKNIAFNSLASNGDNAGITDMLEKMAIDSKYRPYYDQIYFALGKAELKNNASDKALTSFRKSVDFNQNNRKQKGLSFAALGDEYYKRNDYALSKASYDSAAMFLTDRDEPAYTDAKQRSLSLDRIAAPAREVQKQDSLLHLSTLSEKEQRANARKYIRELERMMNDSAFLASSAAPAGASSTMPGMGGGSTQWYFANPILMQQGENDFKMKWGNRTLKDNWNRSTTGGAFDDVEDDDAISAEELQRSRLPDEDSLIAAIPRTPEDIQKANQKLEDAYFQLGKAYYSLVMDYPKANTTYDALDKRYPEHKYSAEVLYHRYLMAMKDNKVEEANRYNAELQSKYAASEWAKLLKEAQNTGSVAGEAKESINSHYDKTYDLLNERKYAEVLVRTDEVERLYPGQAARFQKKYNIVKAAALAGNGNFLKADTMLTQFLAMNPKDSLAGWATDLLNYIKANTPPPAPVDTTILPATSASATDTSTTAASSASVDTTTALTPSVDTAAPVKIAPTATGADTTSSYAYAPAGKHYAVVYSTSLDGRLMGLKSGLNDYNKTKHSAKNLTTSLSPLQSGQGMIICREFPNAAEAKKYIAELKAFKTIFREYENPADYDLSVISQENLDKLLLSKDYSVYKKFYQKQYK